MVVTTYHPNLYSHARHGFCLQDALAGCDTYRRASSFKLKLFARDSVSLGAPDRSRFDCPYALSGDDDLLQGLSSITVSLATYQLVSFHKQLWVKQLVMPVCGQNLMGPSEEHSSLPRTPCLQETLADRLGISESQAAASLQQLRRLLPRIDGWLVELQLVPAETQVR